MSLCRYRVESPSLVRGLLMGIAFPPRRLLAFECGDSGDRLKQRRRAEGPAECCFLLLSVVGAMDFWREESLVAGVGVRRLGPSSVVRRGVFRALV